MKWVSMGLFFLFLKGGFLRTAHQKEVEEKAWLVRGLCYSCELSLVPAQDASYVLILWYVSKIIYLS